MYKRILKKNIEKKLFQGKCIILTGARQTGKTTLSLDIIKNKSNSIKIFNCDNPTDRELLNNQNLEFLKQLIGDAKLIFIDEGQKVESIGQTLKLLVDHYKDNKQILVTGSSSIHLLDSTQEALTGRKFVFTLFPLSLQETYPKKDLNLFLKELPGLLVYGSYPEIVHKSSFQEKAELLKELASSYLYKDILEFQQIRNPAVLNSLLKALALQLGSEVSYNELANLLGIDKKTVEKYIDLLEKNYVVFRLPSYSKNKRRELSHSKKIFFYDLGIRNAIINNFNFMDSRNDTGALWENFMIIERMKYRSYQEIYADQYFWRTYDGSEIDLIEERAGKLFGYEFKWSTKNNKRKCPYKWQEYPNSTYQQISPETIIDFVM